MQQKWMSRDQLEAASTHINKVFGAPKAEKLFKARVTLKPAVEELLGGQTVSTTTALQRRYRLRQVGTVEINQASTC